MIERDLDTGLDYMLARYYSGGMGRFLTTDPNMKGMILQIPLTWNPYTYGRNNPMNLVDPDGEAAAGFAGRGNYPENGVYAILRQVNGAPGIGPAKPFDTEVLGRSEVRKAAAWLQRQERSNPADETVLMGHSMGAQRAIDTARLLGEWKTSVDRLVLIDPVNLTTVNISDNVRLTISFVTSLTRAAGGGRVSPGRGGVLIEVIVDADHVDIDGILADQGIVNGILRRANRMIERLQGPKVYSPTGHNQTPNPGQEMQLRIDGACIKGCGMR